MSGKVMYGYNRDGSLSMHFPEKYGVDAMSINFVDEARERVEQIYGLS